MQPSKINTSIMYFGYVVLFVTVIASLLIGITLTTNDPIDILEQTDYELNFEDDEGVPHPQRWQIAMGVFFGGMIGGFILLAVSEALTRLQSIEYNLKRTNDDKEEFKASS